ncbi:Gfo/Idh/MocA family protein [Spirosoma agri]|uniref:Gfo/Idh/MocA family oxidoreductase n=1 Tax=Spirosoma agri TaxID=1987381 RepID=A0A6M0INQ4_9BACT|nr:Gfo/Idh/MocA family oxidoreductase [Spirosoma agri]NEU69597.1 Gfo/Idh/MocA family oxidoreductase [Spirosoma agri]
MDYTRQTLAFKIRKTVRYVRLYGIGRTWTKIAAQYHMKRVFPGQESLPVPAGKSLKHVGIIGCGKFAYANIAYYVCKNYGDVIRGVMDADLDKAISLGKRYQADYYTTDAEAVLTDPAVTLVYIASNHASHTDYAIRAIQNGKAVHIEKPHAVTEDQLVRLCNAMQRYTGRVRLGFNRPDSTLGRLLSDHFARQTGPALINWFVAGHQIEADHWYFAELEGGRILGNLCHWIDFTMRLIPEEYRFPVQIIPTRSGKSDCDISVSYVFGDGSIGTITFSAKGHTFEGVRETMNAHRGNLLASLTDFSALRLDIGERVIRRRLWFRDHGHQHSICTSYQMLKNPSVAESTKIVWESGYLTIKTKDALDTNRPVRVEGYNPTFGPVSPVSSNEP